MWYGFQKTIFKSWHFWAEENLSVIQWSLMAIDNGQCICIRGVYSLPSPVFWSYWMWTDCFYKSGYCGTGYFESGLYLNGYIKSVGLWIRLIYKTGYSGTRDWTWYDCAFWKLWDRLFLQDWVLWDLIFGIFAL